jgi:hypothetical protein
MLQSELGAASAQIEDAVTETWREWHDVLAKTA